MICFLGISLMAFYNGIRTTVILLKCTSDYVIRSRLPNWWVPGYNSLATWIQFED